MRQTIAIVEDDAQQRRYYADALRAHNYSVVEFEDRQQAQDAFESKLPDLAILDIALKLEAGGGYELCRYLKQCDASLPVIFLTSRGDELDKIYGLQLGAWDYQTKPVSLEYLIVRIESFFQIKQLTSTDNSVAHNKKSGDLTINTRSLQCFWKEKEVNLTPTEFSILAKMVEADEAVGVDELIKATHQGVVEDNTINTHILHIRKKFKKIDAEFHCIKTRYGFGYQWLCE
ncbi:MAG: response regulator [Gammaproteobacteria bacterium]|nr:response regulator [Gammaproteobacteria bacterium]